MNTGTINLINLLRHVGIVRLKRTESGRIFRDFLDLKDPSILVYVRGDEMVLLDAFRRWPNTFLV